MEVIDISDDQQVLDLTNYSRVQLAAVDACAGVMPWYKAYWYGYMVFHLAACVALIYASYSFSRRALLPWLGCQMGGLVWHVIVGMALLTTFLSPDAYKIRKCGELSHKAVVRDWAMYVFPIPWRIYWIWVVASYYKELYLVNDGCYWRSVDSRVME